jgi:hypothetical protein
MNSKRRMNQHHDRAQQGQTLLEFALVVIFLVVVLVGIMDFARFFFSYGSLANAAREGARYGIIYPLNVDGGDSPDPDNIMYRTRERLGIMANAVETPFIEVTYPDNCSTVGCRVSVKVTAFFRTWTPLIPRFPMVGQAIMYIE